MKYTAKILSQMVVQLCQDKEIKHIVISPGSRNAPLSIGFTERTYFKNFSIVDERCAAFFALGMAQQLKKPIALVCTSGSALLNYYPAIAEAFYSDIPLVILSADRPSHLLEIGDGQTINQENVFANHILYSANCKEGNQFKAINEEEINKALNTALENKGPVHINIPFSEPLYETILKPSIKVKNIHAQFLTNYVSENLKPYTDIWNTSQKIMVLVGVLTPGSLEQEFVNKLANLSNVIILTETASNISHPNCISSIDQLIVPLSEEEFLSLQPDILLTFGGMIVSKKIKTFLRDYPPTHHWHVDPKKAYNTFFVLTKHFKICINDFLECFLQEVISNQSKYQTKWLQIKKHRNQRQHLFEKQVSYSDFKVFSEIFKNLAPKTHLQLSNSTTIRYSQLFKFPSTIEVFCNRGTSGIDGSMSTAIGASIISEKPTLFITGDLSFFYDSNALWNNYIPANFKIIVINNGGGGIFRILPGEKHTENFDTFFETKHKLNAENLCVMYGFNYTLISSEINLSKTLKSFLEKGDKKPSLLEFFTPSNVNDKMLKKYFEFIK